VHTDMRSLRSSRDDVSAVPKESVRTGFSAWLTTTGGTIADQGLYAGANFAVNILLARWLELRAYGAFAVALSIVYVAGAYHTAVLIEPLMVFGSTRYAQKFAGYLRLLLRFHWALSGLILLLLVGAAGVTRSLGSQEMAIALLGGAAASPFILLIWFVRAACYVRRRPQLALMGSGLYAIVVVTSPCLLWVKGLLSVGTSFAAIGLATLLGAGAVVFALWRDCGGAKRSDVEPAVVFREHWHYGSWNLLATIARFSSSEVLTVLVPVFLGLREAAVIAFVLALMRPLFLLVRVIPPVMLPVASSFSVNRGSRVRLKSYVIRWLLICAGGALTYGIAVTLLYGRICHAFFGGKYSGHGLLVLLFTLAYTASVSTQVLGVVLQAAAATKLIARIWCVPALATLLLSVPVLMRGSLVGVVALFALNYWIVAILTAWHSAKQLAPATLTIG
jgi:O-antigen/teichoic acid export membrane protein